MQRSIPRPHYPVPASSVPSRSVTGSCPSGAGRACGARNVEMLDDDVRRSCAGGVRVSSQRAQQCHTGFDAAFTRYVDAEVEHAAHVAQRHADRVLLPVFPRMRATASVTPEALPGVMPEPARAQAVIDRYRTSPTPRRSGLSPRAGGVSLDSHTGSLSGTIGIAPPGDRLLVISARAASARRTPKYVGVIDKQRSRAPWPVLVSASGGGFMMNARVGTPR